jgi:hypothetical protein
MLSFIPTSENFPRDPFEIIIVLRVAGDFNAEVLRQLVVVSDMRKSNSPS